MRADLGQSPKPGTPKLVVNGPRENLFLHDKHNCSVLYLICITPRKEKIILKKVSFIHVVILYLY